MLTIKENRGSLTFSVYVQPRAAKAAIVGCHDQALKIKLTAPPVGGAANKQCIQLLAKALGLPKSTITITAGLASRHKQIRLEAAPTPFSPKALQTLTAKLLALE
jgi:uncharacterized protein (TIGR00251 family)